MRLLIVKLADIGDLLVATPALAALRARCPDAQIDLLTTSHSAPVIQGTGLVDVILTFDKFAYDRPRDMLRPANLARAMGLGMLLRLRRYDAVLIFHHLTTCFGTLKYAALAWAAGASVRLGLDNGRGRWVGLTDAVPDEGFGARHEVQYWLDVAGLLGADPNDAGTSLRAAVRDRDDAWAEHVLEQHPAGEAGPLAVIHPGSGGYSMARRWDPASFAAVADALYASRRARVVLVGREGDNVEAVRARVTAPVLDVSAKTTLGQLCALLGYADVFIGADSGVMHLAAAAGAPVVAVFGPTNHRAWGPWAPGVSCRVVRSAPLCSPCAYVEGHVGLREGCLARTCMRMVTPEDVLRAVDAVWQEEASALPVQAPPEKQGTVNILGVPVSDVTFDEMLDQIGMWLETPGPPRQIATANPEFVMIAQDDVNFSHILHRAHLVIPDGVGLLWAARRLGHPLRERVTGSDGVPRIAARAAEEGWRLFFLGAAPGVAERAAEVLRARHPGLQVAGTCAGSPAPEEEKALVTRIRASDADILFVAYGAPAQDKWIARNLPRLGVGVAIGVGGALDFVAGVTRRAPVWVQRLGLEWLHRLVREPWRWRRQMRLPRFVWAVLLDQMAARIAGVGR